MKILVTDAYERKALAAVRNLGRKGHYIAAAGAKRWEQSFFSKYCRERLLCPNPARDADEFVHFLLDFLKKNRFDCVLPMSDYTTIALSRHADEFQKHTRLAVPDYQVLSLVRDKPEILKIARNLGIGVPETWCPADLAEVRELSGRLRYPCVIKYKKGCGAIGVRYASSPAELISHYESPQHEEDVVFDDVFPMIQEYVPGGIVDVCCLFDRGEPRAAEVHRRLKMIPPTGGWGASYITVDAPDLREKGLRLLGEVGWHGPAMVEFKVDGERGGGKLMEVNTRFWGGLDVSARAGIDFAEMTARLAVDGEVEPAWDYRVGMRYRCIFSSELHSTLMAENPLEGIFDYLRFHKGTGYDISPGDPLPHVVRTALAAYRGGRRLLGMAGKDNHK